MMGHYETISFTQFLEFEFWNKLFIRIYPTWIDWYLDKHIENIILNFKSSSYYFKNQDQIATIKVKIFKFDHLMSRYNYTLSLQWCKEIYLETLGHL